MKTPKPARPFLVRARAVEYKFGLPKGTYAAMFRLQGGLCAICRRPETAKRNGVTIKLCIDHDHKTRHARALLCRACNVALGCIQDSPLHARALADYLERHTKVE